MGTIKINHEDRNGGLGLYAVVYQSANNESQPYNWVTLQFDPDTCPITSEHALLLIEDSCHSGLYVGSGDLAATGVFRSVVYQYGSDDDPYLGLSQDLKISVSDPFYWTGTDVVGPDYVYNIFAQITMIRAEVDQLLALSGSSGAGSDDSDRLRKIYLIVQNIQSKLNSSKRI